MLYKAPYFIPQIDFDKLKKREQAFIIILYENKIHKYSKKRIMDKLLIDSVKTLDRLQKRVSEIVKRHIVPKLP